MPFIGNQTNYPVVTPAAADTVPLVQGGTLKQATVASLAGAGGSPALRYTIDVVSTADSDPGVGKLRFNHATQASATVLFVDNATDDTVSVATFLAALPPVGWLLMVQADDKTAWHLYRYTALVDGTGYRKFTVVSQAAGGSFDDETTCLLSIMPGGGDALKSLTLAQFAATSSAELRTLLSDETGSGALVFATAPTLSNPIVGTQSPGDNSTKAASTAYTDAAVAAGVAGLSWKQAVRAATTAALTLASDFENGDTIDGVVLATGDRILIKNQASATENGLYVVAASGAPTRATDANSGAELVNASVYVSEGTTLADTQWTCTTNAPITVDTTALTFAQFTGGSGITALTGDVTASGPGSAAATIANDAVSNAKAANMATATLKGRLTAGTGDPEDLTFNQQRQLLNKKQVLTDGANIAVDADLGLNCRVVLGGNRTLDNPTNLVDGDVLNFRIHQDGTGTRTLAYGNKYKFPAGAAPVLSTAASARDFMSCQYDSTDDTLTCVLNKAFA